MEQDLGTTPEDTGTPPEDTGAPADTGTPPEDTGTPCQTGQISCMSGGVNACVDPMSDATNCGSCGNACGAGQSCQMGACVTKMGDGGTPEDVVVETDAATPEDVVVETDAATPEDVVVETDAVVETDVVVETDASLCPAGQTSCGNVCVDIFTDGSNCGACGNACATGQSCRGGACVTPCAMDQSLCGETCVSTASDPANCGGCGNACPTGQMCVAGTCGVVCSAPQSLCTTAMGAMLCADLSTDSANCGACNNACVAGLTCVAGSCTLVCPMGQTACGSACVDTQTSDANCGACGNACTTGRACRAGVCAVTCPTGQIVCNDACVDAQTDSANCGACGNACPSGQSCTAGACVCPTGQTLCGGACVTTSSDARNCGMCGRVCAAGQNCVASACTTAAPGNDLPAGAIVINMTTPASTITGTTAAAANNSGCLSGGDVYYRFTLTRREAVYVDTFGTTYDTGLAFAPSSGTGTITGTCTDDSCGVLQSQLVRVLDPGTYYVVVTGFGSSTGAFTLHFQHFAVGGTVTQITSLTGTQTVTGTTAGTSALTTSCGNGTGPENTYWFATCPSFTATTLSANTCGAATWDTVLEQRSGNRTANVCNDDSCGRQSSVNAAISAGAALHVLYVDGFSPTNLGAYSVFLRWGGCTTGQTACGATCRNLQTDVTNCGACGTTCPTGAACTAGRCACATGQLVCGSACINVQTDRTNCGRCGNVCGGTLSCIAGTCTCPTGQNACGTTCRNLQTDRTNCGACGTVCPTGAACTAGRCACPTGQTACGSTCRNLQTDNNNCGACGRVCGAVNGQATSCSAGVCRPTNDTRANAVALTLSTGELTRTGSTTNATFDGPTGCGTNPANVWYRVTLSTREILYVDTAGSAFDTRLYLTDANGALVANSCNDDAGCSVGGFTSGTQSRVALVLNAGTYYIGVGGYVSTSAGNFTLHVQHIPANYGSFFYSTPITGTATTSSTTLVGTSARTPTCTLGPSGEDTRWFVTCGAQTSVFSLCPRDGATWTRSISGTTYDASMYVYSGQSGTQSSCNDDGGTNCAGTGGDTANYGSRIEAAMNRGINMVVVDERTRANGMRYTMRHVIR